jgi:hypothetical protein
MMRVLGLARRRSLDNVCIAFKTLGGWKSWITYSKFYQLPEFRYKLILSEIDMFNLKIIRPLFNDDSDDNRNNNNNNGTYAKEISHGINFNETYYVL